MLLAGKCVLVAGVGPGLGRSIVRRAWEEGASVALVARSRAYSQGLAEELGQRTAAFSADLTDAGDCARVAREVGDRFGGIDVIVYNAFASGGESRFEDADLREWRHVMDVNAFGALEVVRACLPSLRDRHGSVVLINSRQIRRLGQPRGGYAMSKAALFMAGQVLAQELGLYGVRVNTVVSGWMWGPAVERYFLDHAAELGKTVDEQYRAIADAFPLRRMPLPDDVADAVVFFASDRAASITGQSLDVNAGEAFA